MIRVYEPFPNISFSVLEVSAKSIHAQPDLVCLCLHEHECRLQNGYCKRLVAGSHRLPKIVHDVLRRITSLIHDVLVLFHWRVPDRRMEELTIWLSGATHDGHQAVIQGFAIFK